MRLYIIGNGFDLHHDLRTSYSDFGKFLNKRNISLYDQLLDYFGFEDVDVRSAAKKENRDWKDNNPYIISYCVCFRLYFYFKCSHGFSIHFKRKIGI